MSKASRLEPGMVALVTGASAGIGAAVAADLVAREVTVIAAARQADRLAALAAGPGPRCHPLTLDVTDPAAGAGLLDRLPAGLKEIDILVNNAGSDVGGLVRFDQGEMADWASTVATNVVGLMAITHAVAPGMVARNRGDIVNIGSTSGVRTTANYAVYGATKHAVHGFTESLRLDYAATAIRVIEVMPGMVRTEFASNRLGGDPAGAAAFYAAFPELLQPDDIARCVLMALDQPAHVSIAQILVQPTRG